MIHVGNTVDRPPLVPPAGVQEAVAPVAGTTVVNLGGLIRWINADQDMRTQGYVTKAYGWIDPSTWLNHRFVVLTIEHRSETKTPYRTYYVRIDRRPERNLAPFKFLTNSGKAKSSDVAVLSYDLDKLLASDKRTELECALTLDQPLRLGGLNMMLGAIRVEFSDYKLTEENCWAMASVILELLETVGLGTYTRGALCVPKWAGEVREKVRRRFMSIAFASIGELITNDPAESSTAASARIQDLEAALAAKAEQIDNLERRLDNASGDGRSGSSLADADAVIRAENAERALAEAVIQHKQQTQLLLEESEKQSGTHQNELQAQRRRVRDLTTEQMSLHSQMSGLRAQLAEHVSASGQLRKDLTDCEARLLDATRASSDSELRLATLRNYLAENRIALDIEDLIANDPPTSSTITSARVQELEAELAAKAEQIEDLERRQANESGDPSSSLSDADAITRAENAERALAEVIAHKQQTQRIEEDYQTAVHYINRTEKMMRRVKDEHTRQKQLNSALQGELDALRNGPETSSRTRVVNGRITPLSDDSHEHGMRTQLADAARQHQRATAENTELHKKVAALQTELEQLRESLAAARRESGLRVQQIEDLETEMDRLEAALQAARRQSQVSFAEQLYQENSELKRENDLLHQRIGLLLDVDQPGRNPNRLSGRPDSRSSSIKDHAFDALSSELDDWLATSSTSRRPLSGFESEIPQQSPARGPARAIGS